MSDEGKITMSVVMQDTGLVYKMVESLNGDEDLDYIKDKVRDVVTDNIEVNQENNIIFVKY